MARVEGFEPSTHGFGDRCSTRLSYTPKLNGGRRWFRTIVDFTPTDLQSVPFSHLGILPLNTDGFPVELGKTTGKFAS